MSRRIILVILFITTSTSIVLVDRAVEAADMPLKAPVYQAPPAQASWPGFYGGLAVGTRWADNDWRTSDVFPTIQAAGFPIVTNNPSGSLDSAAARIGTYGGYNWQFAPAWIAGVEFDVGWADNHATANPAPGTAVINGAPALNPPSVTVSEDWDASLRGRLGALVTPDTLVFVTGGFALQNVTLSATCAGGGVVAFCLTPQSESHTRVMQGWTVGGGIERRIWGNWLARVEYRYADFGTFDRQFFPPCVLPGGICDQQFTGHAKVTTQTANVGLALKF
jgi:outer membrane immunogenic protein